MKKKKILKMVKEQLILKREKAANSLKKLYKDRENCEDPSLLESLNSKIDSLINEINMINDDLARKDKKSSRIEWFDDKFKPAPKKNARNATIVDSEAYSDFSERRTAVNNGPEPLWLQSGLLVSCKNRTIPGIVLDAEGRYATVLFGGESIKVRKLALRPAEWDD